MTQSSCIVRRRSVVSDTLTQWKGGRRHNLSISSSLSLFLLLCLKYFWVQDVRDLLLLILGPGGRTLLPPCRLPPCRHTCKVNIHSPLRLCWIMFFKIYIFKNGVVGIWEKVVFVTQLAGQLYSDVSCSASDRTLGSACSR